MIRESRIYCGDCGVEILKLTEIESHKVYESGGVPWQKAELHLCSLCASKRWKQPEVKWPYATYFAPKFILANFWRVRRIYFDALKACTKNEELRKDTPFWRARLLKPAEDQPNVAYFTCGNDELYRLISSIVPDVDPEMVLGRSLSDQGSKDIPTPTCIATYLGRLYDR
jgi:hypothetical protein